MRRFVIVMSMTALFASCSGTTSRPADVAVGTSSTPDGGNSAANAYRHLERLVQQGDVDSIAELFAENATYRDRTFDFEVQGRDAIREVFGATVGGVGDRRMHVRRIVASGDTVVMEWVLSGTFVGPILGVAADSMPIEFEGISIGLVVNGRIMDHTDYLDRASLEARLGLRPSR